MIKMNAVLLSGGIMRLEDPLYHEGREGNRSLIGIHGKPMVQWVLDALNRSDSVAEVYVMGLGPGYGLEALKPIHFLPDEGGLFENIRAGVLHATQDHPSQTKVLIVSSDIPALQPEMVDWLIAQVTEDPTKMLYYNVISQTVMETRFPDARRSYVRFKNIGVCGGDMNVVDRGLYTAESPLWKQLSEARKHPFKQMGLLGIDNLILIGLRALTLEVAVRRICKRLKITAKALVNPYAEVGMDADKTWQLDILRRDLEGRL